MKATASDFSTRFLVDENPEDVFSAINHVRGWWSEQIDGRTDAPGETFTYRYKDVHICTIKIIEFIPAQKVVWLVMDNFFNFTKDRSEWKDTRISFEISRQGNKTQLRFTHMGLVPEYECFDLCTDSWGQYIGHSLRNLITTGKGQPNPIEKIVNEAKVRADKMN